MCNIWSECKERKEEPLFITARKGKYRAYATLVRVDGFNEGRSCVIDTTNNKVVHIQYGLDTLDAACKDAEIYMKVWSKLLN